MNPDDLKKLLDESLQPIRNDLDELKNNHSDLKTTVDDLKTTVGGLKTTVDDLKYTMEERVLPSVTYIETNIKAYKDSYQANNSNAKRLEKRIEALEDNVGINPPPELTLAEVA